VAPHLSSCWQHNYSTKTSPAGCTNEQSMYSLMSMNYIHGFENMATKVFEFPADQKMDQVDNFAIRLFDYFATMVKF
jgi:hypothetical protein